MGYEKRKAMGQKPDVAVKGKAKGEEKVPHKSPKMTDKSTNKKMSVSKKTVTKKKM